MGRRPKGETVRGPYRYRNKWRVVLAGPGGGGQTTTIETYFDSEADAQRFADQARAELAATPLTVQQAMEAYGAHLRKKGNQEKSIERTMWSLRRFFEPAEANLRATELPMVEVTQRRCQRLYEALVETGLAVDSHRNALAETKSFFRWACSSRLISRNPCEAVQGQGKRSKGKPQLRFAAARAWYYKALELAEKGDDGAIAALMLVLLGPRCEEVVEARVEDVDAREVAADTFWIPDSKTPAGRRVLEVPEVLQPFLVGLTEARRRDAWLFPTKRSKSGHHDRGWPRHQVKRICKEASVPAVTAHSMRGLHATITLELGVTGALVAKALGHADERTTRTAYADSVEVAKGVRRRALRVLQGGKDKT
jgi:integrase